MTPQLRAEIETLLNRSNLAYLHNRTDGVPHVSREPQVYSQHGACLPGGDFISCLVSSPELPAGQVGLVYEHREITYSAYVRVGDEDWPAPGAVRYHNGSMWSFATVVELPGGQRVLADAFKSTTFPTPRPLGRVEYGPESLVWRFVRAPRVDGPPPGELPAF